MLTDCLSVQGNTKVTWVMYPAYQGGMAVSVMDVYSALREAGMDEGQAKVIAASTDLSQVATKADLADLRREVQANPVDLQSATKAEFTGLRRDIRSLDTELTALHKKLAQINRRLNGLYWFIGGWGLLLVILEVIPFLFGLS